MKKAIKMIAGACAAAVVCAGGLLYYNLSRQNVRHTSATFVMDAVADQKVYGPNGEKAIAAAEQAFREMENRLSVYKEGSDIARLNAAAGSGEAVRRRHTHCSRRRKHSVHRRAERLNLQSRRLHWHGALPRMRRGCCSRMKSTRCCRWWMTAACFLNPERRVCSVPARR